LAGKARLSEARVQAATADLTGLGELTLRDVPKGTGTATAFAAQVQILHPYGE